MVAINEDSHTEIGVYKKAFSIFMALYPLLCIYKGISNFTIGDLMLIGFFFVALFKQKTIILDTRIGIILTFILYAFLVLIINLSVSNVGEVYDTNSLFIRLIKFAFYMSCVLICGRNFLNRHVFKKNDYLLFFGGMYIRYLVCYSSKKYRRCEI